ncbi:MAG: hypothetical protein ACO3PR_07855, partial [Limisphaerales bacterium]
MKRLMVLGSGGRPVKVRDARRKRVASEASGAGVSSRASRLLRTNVSIGLRTHDASATAGSGFSEGAMNAQWVWY